MNTLPLSGRVQLAPADMHRLADGVPVWIECLDGALWISQTAEPRDIVIAAGGSMALAAPRDAIIGPVGGKAAVLTEPLDSYRVAA